MNFDLSGLGDDELDELDMTPADIRRYIETGQLPGSPKPAAQSKPIAQSKPVVQQEPEFEKIHFEPGKVHPNVLTVRVLMVILPLLVVIFSCVVIYSTRPH